MKCLKYLKCKVQKHNNYRQREREGTRDWSDGVLECWSIETKHHSMESSILGQLSVISFEFSIINCSLSSFFEPDWAWALYLNKGATGVGFKKEDGFHLWPVASTVD